MNVISIHRDKDTCRVRGPAGMMLFSLHSPIPQALYTLTLLCPDDLPVSLRDGIKQNYKLLVAEYDESFCTVRLSTAFTLSTLIGPADTIDQDEFAAAVLRDEVRSGKYMPPWEFIEPSPATFDTRVVFVFDKNQNMPVSRIAVPIDAGMWRVYYNACLRCRGRAETGANVGEADADT